MCLTPDRLFFKGRCFGDFNAGIFFEEVRPVISDQNCQRSCFGIPRLIQSSRVDHGLRVGEREAIRNLDVGVV